jgi:glycine C-acetyltransferase
LKDFSNVLLCGTGSKCLSTNIGFVGTKDPKIFNLLRYLTGVYNNATTINPAQAAASLAQLSILRSSEGVERRRKVTENYNYLRKKLEANGHRIIGNPCAIMPLFIGNEIISRLSCRLMMDSGIHVNSVEYPVVKIGQSRIRICLFPQHTKAHLDQFVTIFEKCMAKSKIIMEKSISQYEADMKEKTEAKL